MVDTSRTSCTVEEIEVDAGRKVSTVEGWEVFCVRFGVCDNFVVFIFWTQFLNIFCHWKFIRIIYLSIEQPD